MTQNLSRWLLACLVGALPPAALADSVGAPTAGANSFRHPLASGGDGPLMIRLPGGRFEQGSASDEVDRDADEGPRHAVTLRPFALGKYEVTRAEFERFVTATGYRTDAERNTPIHLRDGVEGCLTYLGAGVLSVDELADRLFVTLATQPGQDF